MRIAKVEPEKKYRLRIVTEDGTQGIFDVTPYLEYEVFSKLKDEGAFKNIFNGKYFIEWDCGADLSADTIEAHLEII
ncbi:MAG: DUF2442 domain-containing protein [Melioribacteraceae bacterium]|nr:DUF2442 domain-containing protein [Melioribacteraceae bacterium]